MASFYGVNNTKQYQNVPSEMIPIGEQAGRLRVAYDKISLSETIVGGGDPSGITAMQLPMI